MNSHFQPLQRRPFSVAAAAAILLTSISTALARRQMEKLGRGLVAICQGDGKVFLSRRLFSADPRHPGEEIWSGPAGLRTCNGERIGAAPRSANFAIWWDGVLLRELLDRNRIRSGIGPTVHWTQSSQPRAALRTTGARRRRA